MQFLVIIAEDEKNLQNQKPTKKEQEMNEQVEN